MVVFGLSCCLNDSRCSAWLARCLEFGLWHTWCFCGLVRSIWVCALIKWLFLCVLIVICGLGDL